MSEQLWQIRKKMWRSLDDLAGADEGEFPPGVDSPDGWSRRNFMKLLGASMALAAVGCERDVPEKILPYSLSPRGVVPGVPQVYATHWLHEGFAVGLLVRSNEGRPTKVEGNPDHPASLGGTSLYDQALVLGVYDPDRASSVRKGAEPSSWETLFAFLQTQRPDRGAGLRLLLEPTSSPTVARLLQRARSRHPEMKVTFHSPANLDNTLEGARLAFGRPLQPIYHLDRADVIVALDADLLCQMPFALHYSRRWAERRRSDRPNRLYAVECAPSVTGLAADHRHRSRSSEIEAIARAIAGGETAVARDLHARPKRSTLVAVGERQPPAVHALGHALNAALGNLGTTVTHIEPLLLAGDLSLAALAEEMRSGKVDTLLILDGNPVYGDMDFAGALSAVRERVYVGLYENETARAATWFAPLQHPLEQWGDGRAYDGTLSFSQPLLNPFRGGRSVIEALAALGGDRNPHGERLVRESHPHTDINSALQLGLVPGSAAPTVSVQTKANPPAPPAPVEGLEVNFQLSPTLHDGRFSNNAWLLEQPEPVTKLTWGNAVLISPATATRLNVHTQDLVKVGLGDRSVQGPILVTPGHADDAVTLWLGYGRQGAESLADGVGFNAYPLRRSHFAGGATVQRIPGTEVLAQTQRHYTMHGREIALSATRDEYARDPDFTAGQKKQEPSLMPPHQYEGLQWAMSIDLSICTGCSSCMLACQSENNLPVVGKENVIKKREMHWLRVDSYFHGSVENPGAVHQPMMCQHCETAPCEYVCPVNATVHSSDGLNEMVYNRCVGTRFCSNNCPYKVRRFNWFNWFKRYSAYNGGSYQLVHNPDVTVRDRGVMEKCTYCVQRIRVVTLGADLEDRPTRPGEVVTACQQACPTGAIQFGSLSHPDTPMVKWRQEKRSYAVLNDQGTRPRTMYLARIDNPNPDLK